MILTPEKVSRESNFAYDTQEKKFFNYITYNDDYSYKKEIYMVTFPPSIQKANCALPSMLPNFARTIKGES